MRKSFYYSVIPAVILLLTACSKEMVNKEVNTAGETCFQFVAKDTGLSCFQAALERIELAKDPLYLQNGPYTFFAPVNEAFKNAGLDKEAIKNYDLEALKKIVYAHVLNGRLGSPGAGGFYKISAQCLDPIYRPILSRNYYGTFLNGSKILATTELGDGIVHKTESVTIPVTENCWQIIESNPQLSMFVAAAELTVSPPDQTFYLDIKRILSVGAPNQGWMEVTALCPTNEAFHTLGYKVPADLQQLDLNSLRVLLVRHLSVGYNFTSDFFMAGSLQPGSRELKIGSSIIFPELLQTNIKASNGVVHIIDQVIL